GSCVNFFHLDCLASEVNLNVDLDCALTVVAQGYYRWVRLCWCSEGRRRIGTSARWSYCWAWPPSSSRSAGAFERYQGTGLQVQGQRCPRLLALGLLPHPDAQRLQQAVPVKDGSGGALQPLDKRFGVASGRPRWPGLI